MLGYICLISIFFKPNISFYEGSNCWYQKKSKVLCNFTPNKSYAYLLNVAASNLVFLKTYNIKFDEIIIKFTNQNSRSLEIEDKVNLTLLINK